MPKFSPNLHLIQTMTLFLNSNIYEVTFLHMTLWFYNTSKPISRTQFTQYLSDHFGQNVMHSLSFPRPNLKRRRPTSVLWSASTRTPPTISPGDLPFEVITFVNFIPAQMPWLNWTSLGHLKNVFWKALTLTFSLIPNILRSTVLRLSDQFSHWLDHDGRMIRLLISIEKLSSRLNRFDPRAEMGTAHHMLLFGCKEPGQRETLFRWWLGIIGGVVLGGHKNSLFMVLPIKGWP